MSWFSAIVLRLFLGATFGFSITLAISYSLLHRNLPTSNPLLVYIILLGPLLVMLLLGFFVPEWILHGRYHNRLLRTAEGKIPVEADNRRVMIEKGIREFGSVWYLPGKARLRLEEYITSWVRTLTRDRVREPILWELAALSWYRIRSDRNLVQNLRSLVMEQEELDDAAFDVGLSILEERDSDVDLAILLAREGLGRDLEFIGPERQTLLENAWLAAYAKDESLRPHLLPILTRRFLASKRRDEVTGRIYLDAFIEGERASELREEMRKTSDVLARTGRSPEMTANLRALADSGEPGRPGYSTGAVGTILQAPSSWSREPRPHKAVRHERPATREEHQPDQPTESEELGSSLRTQKKRATSPLILIAIIVLVLLVGAGGGYYYLYRPTAVEKAPELIQATPALRLSQPGDMLSSHQYTLQVAALPTEDAAVNRIRQLRAQGLDAYYVITERNDTRWFRIRFGEFGTTREAAQFADSLREAGVIQEYFVATFEPGIVPQDATD